MKKFKLPFIGDWGKEKKHGETALPDKQSTSQVSGESQSIKKEDIIKQTIDKRNEERARFELLFGDDIQIQGLLGYIRNLKANNDFQCATEYIGSLYERSERIGYILSKYQEINKETVIAGMLHEIKGFINLQSLVDTGLLFQSNMDMIDSINGQDQEILIYNRRYELDDVVYILSRDLKSDKYLSNILKIIIAGLIDDVRCLTISEWDCSMVYYVQIGKIVDMYYSLFAILKKDDNQFDIFKDYQNILADLFISKCDQNIAIIKERIKYLKV